MTSMRGLGPFLRDVWRLAAPYYRSEERWLACGLLATIIAVTLALVGLNVVLSYWSRAFYDTLQHKDWDSFISLLLFYGRTEIGMVPGFCVIAAVYVTVAVYRTWLSQLLRIRWRRWMTEHLLQDWLADRAYWRMALADRSSDGPGSNGHGTDNPDQRIADDLRNFADDTLSLGLGLLSSVVTLFSFVTILWTLSGPVTVLGFSIPGYMVWVALVYAAIGSVLTHLVGRPLAALNFRQQRVEADFRFGLARMRENLEGIALYGGEAEENRTALQRFGAVLGNFRQIMDRTKLVNAFVTGFDQIAVVFPLVIAAPRYFAGEIALGGLTQTTGSFRSVEGALAWFVHAYTSLADWRATVERLAAFRAAIAAARNAAPGVRLAPAAGADYVLEDVALDLPDGRPLLRHQNIALEAGQSVAIGGRSGLGKSTLFRALAGIWPFGAGTVRRPDGTTLFLPQRPYLPLGSLRRAIAYPEPVDAHPDAALREVLHAVGLGHLEPMLDEERPWTQLLSGGELQRVAMARALLIAPDWLFLDEATSSLDPESEAELYGLLRSRLPGTSVVSIAHRPTVAEWHARRLRLHTDPAGAGKLAEASAA
jgi:vitamin B12/bleomycin/antimicrobial peptide transport system ATP-binding/permease protein